MSLRNKILVTIFGLLLLNLTREYLFVQPISADRFKVDCQPIEFNVNRRGWDYYSSVFNRCNVCVKQQGITLPYILRGTVIGNPSRSFAIIEVDGKQELCGLGDIIGGARVVALNRDRVVLDYNGVKQELTMCKAECKDRPSPDVSGRTIASHPGVDFAKLLTQLRIRPYFEGGRCVGFQVSNVSTAIRQMGLRDGDIVESINGIRVDDPLKALEILYKSNPVHLGIERGDEKIELDCKVEG